MPEINENGSDQNKLETLKTEDTKVAEGSQEETIEQINWRKFRKKREEERKLLEETQLKNNKQAEEIAALKSAIEAVVNKSPQEQSVGATEEPEEVKIKNLIGKSIEEYERKRDEQRNFQEKQELPQKLNQTFSDFNNVCSHENLDYLEYHYPEVAAGYKHMPDSFEKWANIYKAIKRFIPNPDHSKDQKKMEKNSLKPQSMNAAGMTQSGDSAPMIMDDKRRADNWARMQRVMRGLK